MVLCLLYWIYLIYLLLFDTIHHDNFIIIIEKYVGICGNALQLIK